MIRRGKAEGWLQLPSEAFLPWATINEINFTRTVPGSIPGRGGALLASEPLYAASDQSPVLVTVPKDLILSLERVQQHAKVDKDFREVLENLGDFGRVSTCTLYPFSLHWHEYSFQIPISYLKVGLALTACQTARGAILSFLLVQSSLPCPHLSSRVSVHSPFTE